MSRGAPVGLDIGAGGVRAVEMVRENGQAVVRRYGEVALPFGAVRGGEVIDVPTVSGALRELWATAKFDSIRVRIGLANRRVVVRPVEVPWMEEAELRKSLAFQVADSVPMPIDQALLDFYSIGEVVGEGGRRSLNILLVAAARDMVEMTVQAVRSAGLIPVVVDLAPFALMRSMTQLDHLGLHADSAEALVDIGAGVTNIIVHTGGVPRFVRILMTGGEELTEAVAERLGIPLEEAESRKRGMSLVPSGGEAEDRALDGAASDLVDEISVSLNYYSSQPGALRVERLLMSGGGSRLGGLVERLSSATRSPVEPSPALSFQEMRVSALAAGLATSVA